MTTGLSQSFSPVQTFSLVGFDTTTWIVMIPLALYFFFLGLGFGKDQPGLVVIGGMIGVVLGLELLVLFGVAAAWWIAVIFVFTGFLFLFVGLREMM